MEEFADEFRHQPEEDDDGEEFNSSSKISNDETDVNNEAKDCTEEQLSLHVKEDCDTKDGVAYENIDYNDTVDYDDKVDLTDLPSKNVDQNSYNKDPEQFISIVNESVDDENLDLSLANANYQPYRDQSSLEHTNHNIARNTAPSYTSTTTSVAPEEIKQRVRKALSKQKKAANQRRLHKGESAVVTKERRNIKQDVKAELDVRDWFG